MKLRIEIAGNPKINSSILYTRKGKAYTPETEIENERALRASIISRLPFDFKPFTGAVKISTAVFSFNVNHSFSDAEKEKIKGGALIEKSLKPDLIDCLNGIIKAMTGIVILNSSQICRIEEFKKHYASSSGITLEIEEAE